MQQEIALARGCKRQYEIGQEVLRRIPRQTGVNAHGRTIRMPGWIDNLRIRLYLPFMNRLYADELHQLLGDSLMRWVHQFDKREGGWSR